MIFPRWFSPRIRLSGYMIVRNVVRQGYPYLEAIQSVLPQCGEFLVQDGFSTDETWAGLELLRDRYPKKIRLFREHWEGSTHGGQVLAEMSNRLRRECRGRYCLNLQANEVVPPEAAAELARLPELYPKADLFQLPFLTFMGPRLAWMLQYRARLFRNDPNIVSRGDAYDVGPVNPKKQRKRRGYSWKQIELARPIRRYRGLCPVNFLRKTQERLELFQAEHARYFTARELAYGQKILGGFDQESDSPHLFWERMRIYLEEIMWQENENGLRPEPDSVRPMLGLLPGAFPPLEHLGDKWEYDFAESCRRVGQDPRPGADDATPETLLTEAKAMTPVPAADRPPLNGRRVLFIVPVTPAFTGNGLAMRAASLLAAMRDEGASVRLIIIPAYKPHDQKPSSAVAALCRTWLLLPPPKRTWWSRVEEGWLGGRDGEVNPLWPGPAPARWRRRVERVLSETPEEMLVGFRLSAFSFLSRHRIERQPCWLDLDELDSAGWHGHAALAAASGNHDESRRLDREAFLIEKLEIDLLARTQWLSVASEAERRQLPGNIRARAFIVPNTVRRRALLPPRETKEGPFRCLFVGSFGHPPNVDAVVYFCRDILPRLRQRCDRPVELVVAGLDFARRLSFLESAPGVRILGWVEDLEPVYQEADIVVVPLRAAAGTRIKILEAFSFGRAVVSTPTGAEGLGVKAGRELLLASDAESFAQACAALLAEAGQQSRLVANARAYVQREHSPQSVREAWRGKPVEGGSSAL